MFVFFIVIGSSTKTLHCIVMHCIIHKSPTCKWFTCLEYPKPPWNKTNRPCSIYHYILAWLRGFQVKIAKFLFLLSLNSQKRIIWIKRKQHNIEVWPESLAAMLEYWYIKCTSLLIGTLKHKINFWLVWCDNKKRGRLIDRKKLYFFLTF